MIFDILQGVTDLLRERTGTAYVVAVREAKLHLSAVGMPEVIVDLDSVDIRGRIDTDGETLKKLLRAVDFLQDEYREQLRYLLTPRRELTEYVCRVLDAIAAADAEGHHILHYIEASKYTVQGAAVLRAMGYDVDEGQVSLQIRW